MLRSDATKHGELATLQVNHLETKSKSSRLEVVGGRLSDTNTAKGRPLQVNKYSECCRSCSSCEGLVVVAGNVVDFHCWFGVENI